MILDLPKLGQVEFDDNLTPAQLQGQIEALASAYDFKAPRPEVTLGRLPGLLGRGVARGVGELGIALGDVLPAMAASAVGAEDYAKQQMEEAARSREALEAKYPRRFRSYTEVGGPLEALGYASETIGELVPSVATAVVPGGIGATLGRRAGVAAAERAMAMPLLESGATAAEVARAAAASTAAQTAAQRGMLGGVFMGSFVQNAPEVFQGIYQETGALEPALASLFGGIASTLDSILPASLLTKLGPYGKVKVAENLIGMSGAAPSVMAKAGTITKAVGSAAAKEGMTEATQEVIGALAEQVAGSTKSLLDPENIQRYKEAFVAGAVGGSVFGVPGGVAELREAKRIREEQAAAAKPPAPPSDEQKQDIATGEVDTVITPPGSLEEAAAEKQRLSQEASALAAGELEESSAPGVEQTPLEKAQVTPPAAVKVTGEPSVTGLEPAADREGAGVVTPAGADVAAAPGVEAPVGLGVAPATEDVVPAVEREGEPTAPVASWKDTTGGIHYKVDYPVASGKGRFTELIAQEQAQNIALRFTDSKGNSDRTLAVGFNQKGEPYWFMGDAPENTIRKNIGDRLYNSIGSAPITNTQEFDALVARIKNVLDSQTKVVDETQITPPVEAAPGVAAEVVEPGVRPEAEVSAPAGVAEGVVQAPDTEPVPAVDEAAAAPEVEKPPAPAPYKVVEPKTGRMIKGPELRQAIEAGEAKRKQLLAETEQKITELTAQQQALLTPKGKPPAVKSPRRKQYDALGEELVTLEAKRKSYAEEATAPTTRVEKPVDPIVEEQGQEVAVRRGLPEISEAAATADFEQVQTLAATGRAGTQQQVAAFNYFSKHNSLQKVLRILAYESVNKTPKYRRMEGHSDATFNMLKNTGGAFNTNAIKWVRKNLSAEANAYLDAAVSREQVEATKHEARLDRLTAQQQFKRADAEQIQSYVEADAESTSNTQSGRVNKSRTNRKKALNQLIYDVYQPAVEAPRREGAEPLPPTDVSKLPKPIMQAREEAKAAARLAKIADNELFASPEIAALQRAAHPVVRDALAEGNIVEALQRVGATSELTFANKVAKALAPFLKNVKVVYGAERASYDPATNTINLPENATDYEILHEATHAAVSHVIATNPSHPVVKRLQNIFDDLNKRGVNTYATTDLQEFVAEAWSNNDFRTLLKENPAEGTQMSLWDKLVNALRSFFGYPPKALKHSLLDNVDAMISEIISPAPDTRNGDTLYAQAINNPNIVQQMFNALNDVIKSQPIMDSAAATKWVDVVGKAGATVRDTALKFLNLSMVGEVATARFKQLIPNNPELYNLPREIADNVEKMEGNYQRLINAVNPIAERLTQLRQEDPDLYNRLSEYVTLHSKNNVDPRANRTDYVNTDNLPLYDQYKKQYNSLGSARQLYDDVFNAFRQLRNEFEDSLKTRIDRAIPNDKERALSTYNRLIQQITLKTIDHYFPLYREGDRFVEFIDTNGERNVIGVQGYGSENRLRRQLEANGINPDTVTVRMAGDGMAVSSVIPGTMAAKIVKIMQDANVGPDAVQEFLDMFVSYMPETSILKSYNERKGVPGYIKDDAAFVFDRATRRIAKQVSRLRYSEALRSDVTKLDNVPELKKDGFAVAMLNDLGGRVNFAIRPNINNFAQIASSSAFYMNLAGNVSSAFVNTMQTPVATYPQLAGEYGYNKAAKALLDAVKLYGSSGFKRNVTDINGRVQSMKAMYSIENHINAGKHQKYKPLIEAMLERGLLQNTIVGDIVRGADQSDSDLAQEGGTSLMKRVTRYSAFLFHHAERMNREVSAMAAYDLEMDKLKDSKMPEAEKQAQAIRKAIYTVQYTHGAGHSTSGPSISQGNIGKVLTVFKRFGFTMYYMLFDTIKRSLPVRGASEAEREAIRVARRQLVGTYIMAGLFAGVKGLPLYWILQTAYDMLAEDDEDDFDAVVRKYIGDLPFKGPVNYFTGLSIADRVGWQDLLYRENRSTDSSAGQLMQFMETILGAPFAVVNNIAKGADLVGQGEFQRGIELMLPVALRNLSKFERYMTEGATTLRGDLVGEINGYNAFMQALGFAPAELINQYERNANLKRIEKAVKDRSSKLLKRYYAAYRSGDYGDMLDAMEELYELGARHPGLNITPGTFKRSIKARDRISREMYHGVSFQRNLRPELLNNAAEYD